MDPPDRKPVPLVDPQFSSVTGRFSPDGRWIAYSSNESGKNEISVRPFDAATGTAGGPVIVTSGGGRTPLWRGDGKELFYIAADGMATALEVKAGATFHVGTPKPLFKVPAGLLFWDVAPKVPASAVSDAGARELVSLSPKFATYFVGGADALVRVGPPVRLFHRTQNGGRRGRQPRSRRTAHIACSRPVLILTVAVR